MRWITVVVAALLLGCSANKNPEPEQAEAKPEKKSTAKLLVDGITGRYAVEEGKKAKASIQDISAERQKDINEFLEE